MGEAVGHNEHARNHEGPNWAVYCDACRAEAAALAELRALREQAVLLAVEWNGMTLISKLRALGEPAAEGGVE